jgi:hypothetical protein
MNLQELKELIAKSLTNETFKLKTTDLTKLKTLGANYLADATLELSSATLGSSSDEKVLVTGTGTALPFKGMAVKAEFYLLNGEVALEMTATAEKKDWKLTEAIPVFKDTIADKIPFKDSPAKPTFYLLSDARNTKAAGLTFDATIDIDKIPDFVK